jgi:hypothetical protein
MVALEQIGLLVISVWREPGQDVAMTFRARIRWSSDIYHMDGEAVAATRADALAVVRAWIDGFADSAG